MLSAFGKDPNSPTSMEWAEVLRNQHNRITKRNGWQADYPEIATLDEMKLRLRLLEREIRGAEVLGVVRANPKDGTLRNEDQDGDGSGCDTHLEVVQAFAAVEEHWANMAQPFTIELPKAFQRPWTHPKLVSAEMKELGMGVHPKGNRVLDGVSGLPLVPSPGIQASWDRDKRFHFAYQVANVACREPKGPVGMWSNVGADLFMRIRWTTNGQGKLIPADSPRNLAIYWAWVYSCMLTQFMIDWQKRAYDLVSIEHYREVAKLMVEARGDEDKMTNGYTELLQKFGSVDLDSKVKLGSKEQLELAENGAPSPRSPMPGQTW